MSCKMCGMCCKAIRISVDFDYITKESVDHVLDTRNDVDFIFKNWTPISKEEALKINPYLEQWESSGFYYTCKLLVDNKCSIHNAEGEFKPHVCTGFPFYNKTPDIDYVFYTEDCGYKDDIQGLIGAKNKQDDELIRLYGGDEIIE